MRRVCADQHEHIGHSKKEKVSHQGRCGPATRHLSPGTEPPPLSPPSLALLTPQREGQALSTLVRGKANSGVRRQLAVSPLCAVTLAAAVSGKCGRTAKPDRHSL